MMTYRPRSVILALYLALPAFCFADSVSTDAVHFEAKIRPLLKAYCTDCHSAEEQKGDLDLEPFQTLSDVRRHPKVWQSIAEQLADNEMPPKKEKQLTAEEKALLTGWVSSLLDGLARERAGDPGPVVLRRLSNAEYTYTIQDLTRIPSLDPAREFPVDGAAGEGFMNTGQALVMSPALITKYLDAGKKIAKHAVLLPDGIGFSAGTTRRDWADERLEQIRDIYREFTVPLSREKLNLQGIVLDNTDGGAIPLEKYFRATLVHRAALHGGTMDIRQAAAASGVNARYLGTLWAMLTGAESSPLLDDLRARWRNAREADAAALAENVAAWQKALWKFNPVGQLGRRGGPSSWQEAVSPVAPRQELRVKLPASAGNEDVRLFLAVTTAGDDGTLDSAVWQNARLVAPGKPDLFLRDIRDVSAKIARRRAHVIATTEKYLIAAAEAGDTDAAKLAAGHGLEPALLETWLSFLGVGSRGPVALSGHAIEKITRSGNYDFINGWGKPETPNFVANSSSQEVRIPGVMRPHSIAVHPSPTLRAAVGWQSPITGDVRLHGTVQHAHPECGNGVTWALEIRRGGTRQRLVDGIAHGGNAANLGPIENLHIRTGDVLSLLIGSRDKNHSCDLTTVNLTITGAGKTWDLGRDVSPNILAGNPHFDGMGNPNVWHFYTEADEQKGTTGVPAGSILARWQNASTLQEKASLAAALQQFLLKGLSPESSKADVQLYQQITSFGGPFLTPDQVATEAPVEDGSEGVTYGLAAEHLQHSGDRSADLVVQAPSMIEVLIPRDLAEGREFVATGTLHETASVEGSVQFHVLTSPPDERFADASAALFSSAPVIVRDGSAARARYESAFAAFRACFPAALCYTKIVPVDEVVTLTLLHREDDHLARLMLGDEEQAALDRLWNELRYVSNEPLTQVDAFTQLMEYATQDGTPSDFEPLRQPILDRAAAFREYVTSTEPRHVDALIAFARRAYRRPLNAGEQNEVRALYHRLRQQDLPHEDAIRLTLARIFITPSFLYRAETPVPGTTQGPVTDWELATRLSYFLWSSMPDDQLQAAAAAGTLRDPEKRRSEARRLLADPRIRRLATEFACQWLHIRDFDKLDEKSERHFPEFNDLRDDMYEEAIRFFTDLFQRDGSALEILDADHAFVNEALAKHYGIAAPKGDAWQRVDGVKQQSRGGILGQAAILAKQSGASRTSPILRGNWVAEVLLGDKLPRPPKDVPPLPEEEGTEQLTVRQLTEKHSSDPRCSGCHVRIDPFGFALESFDAIGRHRVKDTAGLPLETRSQLMDGTEIDGLDGLRNYLLHTRRDDFLRQFCRKLLGYALGRGVLLSDEPLLAQMQSELRSKEYRVSAAIGAIINSPQFLEIRGIDAAHADHLSAN